MFCIVKLDSEDEVVADDWTSDRWASCLPASRSEKLAPVGRSPGQGEGDLVRDETETWSSS